MRGRVTATDGWSLCVCAFVVLLLRWCVWCGAQAGVSLAVPALVCVSVYEYCFWDPHQPLVAERYQRARLCGCD
eukprot:COSAG06_NODE_304_length_17855_cov_47.399414_5_plen_74_part_00